MNTIVPIYEAGAAWPDDVLETHYTSLKPSVPKVQLAGLMAKRSVANPKLLASLQAEAQDSARRKEIFFGFIKMSWIPVLAVLEHGSDAGRAELDGWLQAWSEAERSLFLGYIRQESLYLHWFATAEKA